MFEIAQNCLKKGANVNAAVEVVRCHGMRRLSNTFPLAWLHADVRMFKNTVGNCFNSSHLSDDPNHLSHTSVQQFCLLLLLRLIRLDKFPACFMSQMRSYEINITTDLGHCSSWIFSLRTIFRNWWRAPFYSVHSFLCLYPHLPCMCVRLGGTQDGSPALCRAAFEGYNEIVQLLLDAGADVEAKTNPVSQPWLLQVAYDSNHRTFLNTQTMRMKKSPFVHTFLNFHQCTQFFSLSSISNLILSSCSTSLIFFSSSGLFSVLVARVQTAHECCTSRQDFDRETPSESGGWHQRKKSGKLGEPIAPIETQILRSENCPFKSNDFGTFYGYNSERKCAILLCTRYFLRA